jgi:ubiquinol-cytochrome c reductase cytochrome b subunit
LFPLFIEKDIVITVLVLSVYIVVLVICPEYAGNSVNWHSADQSVTPDHIIPEWYFLIYYGILKSIASKAGGIVIMLITVFFPLAIPFFVKK